MEREPSWLEQADEPLELLGYACIAAAYLMDTFGRYWGFV